MMGALIDNLTSYIIPAVVVLALIVLATITAKLRTRIQNSSAPRKRGRGIVWTVTLTASAIVATVIVFTQVPFYKDLFGDSAQPLPELLPWLNLAYLTPISLESLAWVFTTMSVFAVVNDKPSGRYEMLMWGLSSLAATINAWHNITGGQAATGLVLGGFSVAAPMLISYGIRWDRDAQSELSADEFRKAAVVRFWNALRVAQTLLIVSLRRGGQLLVHPYKSMRAAWIATHLGVTWDQAYRIALLRQYEAVHTVLRAQFERALPAVHKQELHGAQNGAQDDVHASRTPASDEEIEAVHGPIGADEFPACTDPLIADLQAAADPGALFDLWGMHSPVHEDGAQRETSENTGAHPDRQDSAQGDVHDDVHPPESTDVHGSAPGVQEGVHGSADDAQHDVHEGAQGEVHDAKPERARGSARPTGKRAPRTENSASRVVHARAERQEHTAARFSFACARRGIDPSAYTRADIARRIGINTTAVSRGLKWAETGQVEDQGAQDDEAAWFEED